MQSPPRPLRSAPWFVFALLFAQSAGALEELTAEQVKDLTSGAMDIHLTQHKMDIPFLKRLVKEFQKRLDPSRTIYLQAEADAKVNLANDDLSAVAKSIKSGDLAFFSSWITEFKTTLLPRDEAFIAGLKDRQAEIATKFSKEEIATYEKLKPDEYPATEEKRRERLLVQARSNFQINRLYLEEADAFKLVMQNLSRQREEKNKLNAGRDTPKEVMKAFMSALDPHSEYMDAEDVEEFNTSMARSFAGIGVQIRASPNGAQIMEVIKGGPASKSGKFARGDQIIAVDEASVLGEPLSKIVKRIKGEKSTAVKLRVLKSPKKDEEQATENLTLIRDTIELSELRVTGKKQATAEGTIGVVAVENFYRGVAGDVADRIKELSAAEPLAGLVLDLRGNSGGLLDEAVKLTGLFIAEGPVVAERGKEGQSEWRDDPDKTTLYAGPLVVLVNQFSASASEIVAGSLRDYGRAIVAGPSQTHGKGTVQRIVDLQRLRNPIPGEIRITIQQYFLAGGDSTQLTGVEPEIRIPGDKLVEDFLERKQEGTLPAAKINGRIASNPDYLRGSAWKTEHLATLLENSRRRVALNKDFDDYRKAEKGEKASGETLATEIKRDVFQADPEAVKEVKPDPIPVDPAPVKEPANAEPKEGVKLKDPQLDEAVAIVADILGLWPKDSAVAKMLPVEPVPEEVK